MNNIKNNIKYSIERKAFILKLLEQEGKVEVNALSNMLSVSKETIRRDLREMQQDGLVQRTHGGAVLLESYNDVKEYPYQMREIQNYSYKKKLCERAVDYIEDGDTIFIDSSSTTINMLKYIDTRLHVTVLTNSIRLILESAQIDNHNLTIIGLGGIFRKKNYSLSGVLATEWAKQFRPNKVFISCYGVHAADGLTDISIYEIDTKKTMINNAQKVFVLADSSKIGRQGVVYLCDISKIDYIITNSDINANDEQIEMIQMKGIKLLIVE